MGDTKFNNVELIEELEQTKTLEQVTTMGTVKLTDGAIVYIPTPTADPQDPRKSSPALASIHPRCFVCDGPIICVPQNSTDSSPQSIALSGKNG
jgi:hypothetical protein